MRTSPKWMTKPDERSRPRRSPRRPCGSRNDVGLSSVAHVPGVVCWGSNSAPKTLISLRTSAYPGRKCLGVKT
jgi:hypothetical protein